MRLPPFKIPNRLAIAFLAGLLLMQLLGLAVWWLSWPTSLSFVVPLDEVAAWQRLVADFNEQNPGIRLELVPGDYNTDQAKAIYSADLNSPRRPQFDLVYMDVVWLPWFASEGWLQDLSDLLPEAELAKFLPSELAAGRYQDTLYRLPFKADLGLLFYNKALMAKLGIEPAQTFEELMTQSQQAQAQRLVPWGYLWQGRSYEGLVANFVEVLAGYGGFWIEPSKGTVGLDVGLNQPAAIAAATFLADTIRQGVSPQLVTNYGETESFNQFLEGESLFLRNWPSYWKRANQSDSPLAGQVELASVVAAANLVPQACRGGWGFGIAQKTAHRKEARRAITFLTSATAQEQFVLDLGHLPSRTDLYEQANIKARYDFFPMVLKALENNSVFRPQIPKYDQAAEILRDHLTEILGGASAEEEMRAAAAKTEVLLADL